jgi:hypothetical protein
VTGWKYYKRSIMYSKNNILMAFQNGKIKKIRFVVKYFMKLVDMNLGVVILFTK